jgi:hypothetical protein
MCMSVCVCVCVYVYVYAGVYVLSREQYYFFVLLTSLFETKAVCVSCVKMYVYVAAGRRMKVALFQSSKGSISRLWIETRRSLLW